MLCFSPKVAEAHDVLFNADHLKICIECVHTMMECLSVMFELATQIAHPVDEEFASTDIEGLRVVVLSEGLTLDEAVQDVVHAHFSLKLLIARSHTKHEVLADIVTDFGTR